jgi:murein DD-endopeptidase MepM/ murein hydrolase activator NlpD
MLQKILICATLLVILTPFGVSASRLEELKAQIDEHNKEIAALEKEIEQYQEELAKTAQQAKTLKNQISHLETTVKNLKANIQLTGKRIDAANFTIEELNLKISFKREEIDQRRKILRETIRQMDEIETQSLLEILLAHASFSDFFGRIQQLEAFQKNINFNLQQLRELKMELEDRQIEMALEKTELEILHSRLADQKILADGQKNQKNILFKETKNKESRYKELLAERLAKQEALENEIRAIEEQIRVEIDPNSLPATGSGVLSWPLEPPIVITQYFGNTPFATQNPQVYGGKGHPGIDLRASVGTPVKSSLQGVVAAVNNTISFCRGYQIGYGKWILIRHDNNLSTFYSHLSLVKVSAGDTVEAGQLIGYSGDTGYTEGPHLHFGVFATQGIDNLEYRSTSKTCGGIIMRQPLVAPNAYLNPLSYL